MAADNYSDVVQVLAQQIVEVCMQAIRKSMPSLIAGATINADQIEGEVSNISTTNLAVDASHVQGLGSYVSNMIGSSNLNVMNLVTIDQQGNAHSIATYDPDNNKLFLKDVNINSAQIDDLVSKYSELWYAEIGKASIQTALVNVLKADFIDIADAQISNAKIDAAQITALQAVSAEIANMLVQNANIDFAQINTLGVDNVMIGKGMGGKLYIADLAITDANVVSLTAGELIVKGQDGGFYAVTVDNLGNIVTEKKTIVNNDLSDLAVTGDKIANGTINGDTKIIESSITARTLNVQDIFADNAMVLKLIAQNINVDELFANSAFINKLNTTDITSNTYLQLAIQQVYDETMREVSIRLSDDSIISTVTGSREFSDMVNDRTRQKVTAYYCISDQGTEPPNVYADWSTTMPEATWGDYLWTKTVTEYNNGQEPTIVYQVTKFGEHNADGIVLKITSEDGFTYRDPEGTLTMTAEVYAGGVRLGQADVYALGCIQWFKNGVRIPNSQLDNWYQLTIDLATVGEKAVYSASIMG